MGVILFEALPAVEAGRRRHRSRSAVLLTDPSGARPPRIEWSIVTPADVYQGQQATILDRRARIKREKLARS
jgi:hypothetical protein